MGGEIYFGLQFQRSAHYGREGMVDQSSSHYDVQEAEKRGL
jgi:hypothetical protein